MPVIKDHPIARRQRRPTLARALKEAAKANLPVRRVRIEADAFVIDVGEPEPPEASNPWLAELERTRKQ